MGAIVLVFREQKIFSILNYRKLDNVMCYRKRKKNYSVSKEANKFKMNFKVGEIVQINLLQRQTT